MGGVSKRQTRGKEVMEKSQERKEKEKKKRNSVMGVSKRVSKRALGGGMGVKRVNIFISREVSE